MNSFNLYQQYSNTLNTLKELQAQYRFSAGDQEICTEIQQRIRECQASLTQIIQDMIYFNPFLDTKRTGQGLLNE